MSTFDLQLAISTWRHQFRTIGSISDVQLDELERHLRDHVAFLVDQGFSQETAFRKAREKLGSQFELTTAYNLQEWAEARHKGRFWSLFRVRMSLYLSILRASLRLLGRQKTVASINVIGLAVGICAILVIAQHVTSELGVDRSLPDGSRIARIALDRVYPDRERPFATASVRLAPVLAEQSPAVEAATIVHRLFFRPTTDVKVEDRYFSESAYYFADEHFFDVFAYEAVDGDLSTALDRMDQVVLTEETAIRLFGSVDVVGRPLTANGQEVSVSAVIRPFPGRSHMNPDFIGSIHAVNYVQSAIDADNWTSNFAYNYVKLVPGTDFKEFEASIPAIIGPASEASIRARFGIRGSVAGSGHEFNHVVQPVRSIHLDSHRDVELEPTGSRSAAYGLLFIAGIVLLVSVINFVNIYTAQSTTRTTEVGIRKALGSSRADIRTQVHVEALLTAGASGLLAVVMLYTFGRIITIPGSSAGLELSGWSIIMAGATSLLAAILAGAYPAAVVSGVSPVSALRSRHSAPSGGRKLRKSLLAIQFTISVVLICASLVVRAQLAFLSDMDPGFSTDDTLVLEGTDATGLQYSAFRESLEAITGVEAAGGVSQIPSDLIGTTVFSFDTEGISSIPAHIIFADDHFMESLGITLLEGQPFASQPSDSNVVFVNEAFVAASGARAVPGETVHQVGNRVATIQGIVADFNFQSYRQEITPLAIRSTLPYGSAPEKTVVRAPGADLATLLPRLEAAWAQFVPDRPLQLVRLDDQLDAQYANDRTSLLLVHAFALLAILLSLAGLFGMTSFEMQRRRREMGIRKVLGASYSHMARLLVSDYSLVLSGSMVVGTLLAWLGLQKWLHEFAYRADIGLEYYITGVTLIMILAAITMSGHALRTLRVQPASELRGD